MLQVPIRAVTTDANGKSTVTVALDGKTNGRDRDPHGPDRQDARAGMIEITSGLQEGDQVVVTTRCLPA